MNAANAHLNDAPDDTPTLDADDDDRSESTDLDDDNDDDNTGEPLPIARGTKRQFNMSLEDVLIVPKVKKNSDGSRQRVKASDFDNISKEILTTACSIFRCLIVTRAPFPDSVAVETNLAKEAWHEACKIKDIDVKITPLAVKMVSNLFIPRSGSD